MVAEYGIWNPIFEDPIVILYNQETNLYEFKENIDQRIWNFDYVPYLNRLFHKYLVIGIVFRPSLYTHILDEYKLSNDKIQEHIR